MIIIFISVLAIFLDFLNFYEISINFMNII